MYDFHDCFKIVLIGKYSIIFDIFTNYDLCNLCYIDNHRTNLHTNFSIIGPISHHKLISRILINELI